MDWDELLAAVEKPSRYLGAEINASQKGREAELRFVLAFPDTYEVGMSHLGIQILYELLNGLPAVAAERCFAPWPDMEGLLRKNNLPLTSLETHSPLRDFDLIGFSLQYELSYTNVLNMLDLAGIPLYRSQRGEELPLILAGGPCAFNPAPMEDFIDAFVIGEGEEAILEIAAAAQRVKKKGGRRTVMLAALADIEGLYVPALHRQGDRVRKRIVADLDAWCLPTHPVVPLMKTIHDRITLEIARGCTRGCRFCQAGMVWRPVRERSQERVEQLADKLLCATGYDEISLLSLSSGDYSRIEPLLSTLMERYYEKRVALALPSLRTETLTQGLIENIRRVRKTSFTLAPEAGTQRLRDVINKGNNEAELLATTEQVFAAGWKSVKLYFMLGLPSETPEDLEGIAELAYRTMQTGKQRGQVTVSLSTFVPKAHTPFQWHKQIGLAETRDKQAFLKSRIRHRSINVKWHDARMSLLEGILSRGDQATGRLIAAAFRLGCRFDGWADKLRFDLWEQALAAEGICIDQCLEERNKDLELPWEKIDCGVDRSYLLREALKAQTGEATPDCRTGLCRDCGVCDQDIIRIVTADTPPASGAEETASYSASEPAAPVQPAGAGPRGELLRIKFTKQKAARFLSHAELSEALIRAIKRSGLAFLHSQGFHPHPKISFAFATPVGMESREEYADIHVADGGPDLLRLQAELNAFLPLGLEVIEINRMMASTPSLTVGLTGFSYIITFPPSDGGAGEKMGEKIAAFLEAESWIITRETKDKSTARDIRPFVTGLSAGEEKSELRLTVRIGPEGTVRPMEILTQVLGIDPETARHARIVKTRTLWLDQD